MHLGITRESFGQDDQSWLGSAHGTDAPQTITIDTSTFEAADHYPQGWLKSGLPLQKAEGDVYALWTSGADLAGFTFTPARVPAGAPKVGGNILEHCRVRTANLPVSVDAAGQASAAGRIIFA